MTGAQKGKHESNQKDSHSCCMCHVSMKTLSLSPLLTEMVIISGFIESGSWTWRVCLAREDETLIMGWCNGFEPSVDAKGGKRWDVDICSEDGPEMADTCVGGRKGIGGRGKCELKCLSMSRSARRDCWAVNCAVGKFGGTFVGLGVEVEGVTGWVE